MTDNNAEFLSNWRTSRSNISETTEGIADSARSFFSSLGDKLQDGYDQAYTALPLTNSDLSQEQQEPSWFQLSRFERILGFFLLLLGSVGCFVLGFFLFPVLTLKPRKFVMLWTLGSVLFVLSFGVLQGPVNYCKHLFSKERLAFSVVFFGSILSTIYCSTVLKSTILTLVAGIVEIFAVLYYTLSYFPFGAQTFQMITSFGVRQASSMVGL